ncbi:hypothetical protein GKC56_06630 [Neisseriaceae bacterium PsAf]|nr:hypothetical protein [Neisseriaceae bacterium PsAf]MCV2503047.1 hypothetical protein [Neisseriaceae bacterium]
MKKLSSVLVMSALLLAVSINQAGPLPNKAIIKDDSVGNAIMGSLAGNSSVFDNLGLPSGFVSLPVFTLTTLADVIATGIGMLDELKEFSK